MLTLTLRTDKPEAEIGLFDNQRQLSYQTWLAHRQLAETLHLKIAAQLEAEHRSWSDIEAIICFKGPGSYTGLRVGLSVVNSLATSLAIPIVGETGEDWIKAGSKRLYDGQNDSVILPIYDAPARTTNPK